MESVVVRVSIGHFDSSSAEPVRESLMATHEELEPGINAMQGNLSFPAGIDMEHNAMINMSFWDSLDSAKQMDSFKPMLDLAKEFLQLGVHFDRPILNFITLYRIEKNS